MWNIFLFNNGEGTAIPERRTALSAAMRFAQEDLLQRFGIPFDENRHSWEEIDDHAKYEVWGSVHVLRVDESTAYVLTQAPIQMIGPIIQSLIVRRRGRGI